MQEWLDKYRDVPRKETYSSIDKPMILFLGLTLLDFVGGVSSFLFVVMFLDNGLSIFVAIISAFIVMVLSKAYRVHFPQMFLSHFNWSIGLQKFKNIPNFFTKTRFKIFCP